jgi:hypothetical protein
MVRILYGKQPADLIGGPFAVYVFNDDRVTASTTGCQSIAAARERASEYNHWYGNSSAEVKEVEFHSGIPAMKTLVLTDVSDEDLVDELLRRRATLVASLWNIDDVRELVGKDTDCADLSEEQVTEGALLLLTRVSDGLQDVLAERGNNYTAERWDDLKDEILTQIRGSTPDLGPSA